MTDRLRMRGLLLAAAAELEAVDLCKGVLAWGVLKEPKPDSQPKQGELYPWTPHWRLDGLTLLGALCKAAESPPTAEVLDAYEAAAVTLRDVYSVPYRPEEWNDMEERTKDEVVQLLKDAAHGMV